MTPEETAELISDLRAIYDYCAPMVCHPEIAKLASDLIEQQAATIARLSATITPEEQHEAERLGIDYVISERLNG